MTGAARYHNLTPVAKSVSSGQHVQVFSGRSKDVHTLHKLKTQLPSTLNKCNLVWGWALQSRSTAEACVRHLLLCMCY